ncbi:MAG: alpha/beta hydrolase [Desulfobacteraceae bacterium]|nr:alpha/beta hydrolase [Desulfobacteraceae bacterium]MBC2757711.1 alpha/beta hydrolase [Desulfobacteraceae bacterium]
MSGNKFLSIFFLVIITGCSTYKTSDLELFMTEEATKTFFWDNKRNVSWMECGDPKGFPVFFAHGCPGSRLENIFLDEKARQYGFRIIVFDRPGFGRSDFIEGYPLLLFARDLERVADELKIEKFGLIGWSSGGPPVLAAAYHMPKRAAFVFSVSGYTDFGKYEDAKGLMAKYKLYGPKLSENRPRLFNGAVEMVRWTDIHLPNFYFKMAKEEMSLPDRNILNDPHVADLFIRNQKEAMVSGTRGIIQDLTTQWAPWDFDFKLIKVPAYIFQGKQDSFVPWQFAQHLADNIPDAKLYLYEDRGHLFILERSSQEEIFRLAAELVKDSFR